MGSVPSPPGELIDAHGRRITDIRLSITDRCNFRCTYCMPPEGLPWLDRSELLTYEEHARIVRVASQSLGINSVRITGGEPLVRHDVSSLVRLIAPLGVNLALTTNGTKLAGQAADLKAAGLHRVNVSLDSVDQATFTKLTGRDELPAVLEGLRVAAEVGFAPVKINAVVIRGVNDDGITDLAGFAREHGYELRFIEFMPLDAHGDWTADQVVPGDEILERIAAAFPLDLHAPGDHTEPAAVYRYRDGRGRVGVISSVTHPFCASCDRMRVTSDGALRACLFALDEIDLKPILRSGASESEVDSQLVDAFQRAAAGKWAGHRIGQVNFLRPSRGMSQIGG
ncbi:MAG: GTP 3',8-cyclase MoaA [Acidimicrobiia bacterium]